LVRKPFPIRMDEPLVPFLTAWLSKVDDFLFYNDYTEKTLTRIWAYRRLREIGEQIEVFLYPHWFRAQRASQLHFEYGFSADDLKEWFRWEKYETALRYAKKGWMGLAEKMGVSVPMETYLMIQKLRRRKKGV